jgi:hypothetical protein
MGFVRFMNRNPMLPKWRPPRRRPFFAHRGVAVLRAWRLRAAEERREPYIQTHFAFESGVFISEKKSVMRQVTLAEYDQGSVERLNWPSSALSVRVTTTPPQ